MSPPDRGARTDGPGPTVVNGLLMQAWGNLGVRRENKWLMVVNSPLPALPAVTDLAIQTTSPFPRSFIVNSPRLAQRIAVFRHTRGTNSPAVGSANAVLWSNERSSAKGGDVMRDAHQRRPQEKSLKSIIQLKRNAERGIRSLLSILTLISWKGCARPNKTARPRFISSPYALFL